jgi:hypothetical protein
VAPPTAHFASLRSDLVVVESPAQPQFSNGRQIGVTPGVYHPFAEHRCVVKGQRSIDYMRARCNAPDSPGLWELDADDVPEVTALLSELALADVDRVRDILQAEEQTANRMIILETCRNVLQRMGAAERKPGQRTTVTA